MYNIYFKDNGKKIFLFYAENILESNEFINDYIQLNKIKTTKWVVLSVVKDKNIYLGIDHNKLFIIEYNKDNKKKK